MTKKVLYVINPVAGDEDKDSLTDTIESYCRTKECEYALMQTKGENDTERLQSKIQDYQPDIVTAVGGDGTVKLVAEQLRGSQRTLAILPAGSANGLATELEIPPTIQEAMDIVYEGQIRQVDMLHINQKHYCLHISDIGFNAQLIQRFEESGQRGIYSYVMPFLQEFTDPVMHRVSLYPDDGSKHDFDAVMVAIANARQYGTGAVLNPHGRMDDGVFEICVATKISISTTIDFLIHNQPGREYMKIFSCKRAKIVCHDKVLLQVDGEIIEEVEHLEVAIEPGCLNLMVPENNTV